MAQQQVPHIFSLFIHSDHKFVLPVDGGDYVFTVNFSPLLLGDETTRCVFIPIIDDTVIEPSETLTVIFTVDGRETSTATVTIRDDDTIGER